MCLQPDTPNIGAVGRDYMGLINDFAKGLPTQLTAQQTYQPGFIDTTLSGVNQTAFGSGTTPGLVTDYSGLINPLSSATSSANTLARSAGINDVSNLGAAAAGAVGAVNPGQAALTTQLENTAATNLAAGATPLPSDVTRITQQVRGDWANRGLGDSAPAQLDEALQLYGSGQQALAGREAAAGSAIQAGQNITLPALSLATQQSSIPGQAQSFLGGASSLAGNAGPTLIPTSTAYDALSTTYNAQAAANITGANNLASVIGGALSY